MKKQEYQAIAWALVRATRPLRIKRDEKFAIYYALITGFMQCEDFRDEDLAQIDLVLDEAIRDYKRRNKDILLIANGKKYPLK